MSSALLYPHPEYDGGEVVRLAGIPASRASDCPHAELATRHAGFREKLHAVRITTPGGKYLACWLDPRVDAEIDAAWAIRPSEAFWLHAVAQSLCATACATLVPEIALSGCAPVPQPDRALLRELEAAGMPFTEKSLVPACRYAVVTWDPYRGRCEVCALADECPRGGHNGS